MKKTIFIPLFVGLICFFSNSCKKDDTKKNDCLPTATTFRQIIDKPATIRQQPAGIFYIVEQGTIDGQLIPCNLAADFQVDNLLVTISGDVKATVQGGPGPCCTENFVITKITR
jgi:hypothetical protein